MTAKETVSTIKKLLGEGYRPFEIRKVIKGCSTALIEYHAKTFDEIELKKLRATRIEKLALEKYEQLYYTSTIIDFDKRIKRCHRCHEWKPFEEFSLNKTRWHGYVEDCKACVSVYMKSRYVPAIPRVKKPKPPKKVKPVLSKEQAKLKKLLGSAKTRARKRGLPYDDVSYLDLHYPTHCPVIPSIELTYETNPKNRWAGASIDRIEPAKGYVKGNIQIMSLRANLIKNNSTVEEREAFAEWVKSV